VAAGNLALTIPVYDFERIAPPGEWLGMRYATGFLALLGLLAVVGSAGAQVPTGQLVLRPTQPPVLAPTPVALPPLALPPAVEPAPQGRIARIQPAQAVEAQQAAIAETDDTATASVPVRRPPVAAVDPYAPLGVRAEGFVLYPALTAGIGHTTNAEGAAGGAPSTYSILSPELLIQSEWAIHEATFALRGSYQHFFDDASDDRPALDAVATARIDGSGRLWTVPILASYSFRTQDVSDPDFPAGVDFPPPVHELRGSVGFSRAGPLLVAVAAEVDRTVYENGISGGMIVDQGDRNNTVFGGRARIGYGTGAALAPFVEAEVANRTFDRAVDSNGIRRAGLLQYYRAGVAVDRGPILTGEIALGYGLATFDDPALSPFGAFIVDGNLIWSPTPLSTVLFTAATSLNPTTDPSSAGSVTYDGLLDVAYAWRRNVTLKALAAARLERFEGTGQMDNDITAGLAATWKANRSLWVTAGYEHEWFASNAPGRDFESDSVRVEVRAQR
jgi:hypothetical protein